MLNWYVQFYSSSLPELAYELGDVHESGVEIVDLFGKCTWAQISSHMRRAAEIYLFAENAGVRIRSIIAL